MVGGTDALPKRAALKRFVKSNLAELTSESCTREIEKQLRVAWTNATQLSSDARFHAKDVAEEIAGIVIGRKRPAGREAIIESLRRIPFVRDTIDGARLMQMVDAELASQKSVLTKDDIVLFHHEEHLRKMEGDLSAKARVRAEQQVSEERMVLQAERAFLRREREELQAKQSELDREPARLRLEDDSQEPEVDSGVRTLWWEKLALQADPFPSDQGLDGFTQDQYEDIVVRTTFIQEYLERIERDPECLLGKSVAILGEYGSGKTTLFDVMGVRLAMSGVQPLFVYLDPGPDPIGLKRTLMALVADELALVALRRTGADMRAALGNATDDIEFRGFVQEYVRSIGSQAVLFLDGLHKANRWLEQTWEFLSLLQNLQESIRRQGLRLGIVIAAAPEWKMRMEKSPSLSGSISRVDSIPPVRAEEAAEAVVRRIRAFSTPDQTPVIRESSIREAFRVHAAHALTPPTFRSFLNHIRDRLVVGEYAEVGVEVSPYRDQAARVLAKLDAPGTPFKLAALKEELDSYPTSRRRAPEILLTILDRRGMNEKNHLYTKNRALFQRLRNAGLISYRTGRGGFGEWHLSDPFVSHLDALAGESNVGPRQAVKLLFLDSRDTPRSTSESLYGSLLATLAEMENTYSDHWRGLREPLSAAQALVKRIDEKVAEDDFKSSDLETLNAAMEQLLHALAIVSGEGAPRTRAELLDWFEEAWFAPENAARIVGLCRNTLVGFDAQSLSQKTGILIEHSETCKQVMTLLVDQARGELLVTLVGNDLARYDKLAFHRARVAHGRHKLQSAIESAADHLQAKIRDIAFVLLRAAYGDVYIQKLPAFVDTYQSKNEHRGPAHLRRTRDENAFFDLARGQFAEVIFAANVVNLLYADGTPEFDLKRARDRMHALFAMSSAQKHEYRETYFREHATDILDAIPFAVDFSRKLNRLALLLLDSNAFERDERAGRLKGTFSALRTGHVLTAETKDVRRTIRAFLRSLEHGPKELFPLQHVLVTEGVASEVQLALLQQCLQKNWVRLGEDMLLHLTDQGRKGLDDYEKEPQERLQV